MQIIYITIFYLHRESILIIVSNKPIFAVKPTNQASHGYAISEQHVDSGGVLKITGETWML